MENMINVETAPDLLLIENIKRGTDQDCCIEELSSRHTGIFVNVTSMYSQALGKNNHQEIIKDKNYYVYNAAQQFDPDKNTKFPTFLFNSLKWVCLKQINRKDSVEIPVDDSDIEKLSNLKSLDESDNNDDCDFFCKVIMAEIDAISDDRAKKILEMRYFSLENKNLPWKIISEKVGLSIQGCIDVHDRWIKKIYNKISKKIQ